MGLDTTALRKFIIDEMRRRDMSGREFAAFVGVSNTTIVNALNEREPTAPSLEFLLKLSQTTHTDLMAILTMIYPEIVEQTKLSPDAAVLAQRIQELPEHLQDAIRTLIRGFREE